MGALDELVGINRIIDATSGSDVLLQPMRKALRFKGSGFIVTETDDAIEIELTGVGGDPGPDGDPGPVGPEGTLKTIGRLDATHSPIVLWSFDGVLTDSSGNGRTTAVDTGTIVYTELWPGYRGASFQSCRTKYTNAAVRLTGDFTAEMILLLDGTPNNTTFFACDGSGETSAANALYGAFIPSTRIISSFSEHGAGVNDVATSTPYAVPPPGVPFHYCQTRTSNVIRHYVNGNLLGSASSALTTPDGGSTGSLYVGGEADTLHPSIMVADFKLIGSALSAAQVLAEAQRSIGQLYVVA